MGAHLLFWTYVYRKLQTGGFNLNKLLDTKAVPLPAPAPLLCSRSIPKTSVYAQSSKF